MGGGPPQNTDLTHLVRTITLKGPYKVLETPKRIRLLFNGAFIADSTRALYVWEHEYYPQLYLPMQSFVKAPGYDLRLSHGDPITTSDSSGKIVGGYLELAVRRDNPDEAYRVLSEMVLFAADLDGPAVPLRNYVKVVFNAVDQWFEDDTPIYVHPKDPFKRVDCLQSQQPIRITIPSPSTPSTDIILAESPTSTILYESLLPPRYYLPYPSLQTSYLRPSATMTECPYKGVAAYHHVVVEGVEYEDLVWWYRAPTVECAAVAGLRCFYGERVDLWVKEGGEWRKRERPVTHLA